MMIINTGQRTDIPAFYSDWFYNRIKEGYVYVRNPYFPQKVTKYVLDPQVVDCLCFCSKNPLPMLERLDEINNFRQFWFITITYYLKDVEPYVPHYNEVIRTFKKFSNKVGKQCIGWRYDPIFINEKYTLEYHLKAFEYIAGELCGYTNQCVISFIDIYEKTKRNFPAVSEVSLKLQHIMVKEMSKIADRYHMKLYTCLENNDFEKYGVIVSGCMSQKVIEDALGISLKMKKSTTREGCSCVLGNDIGAYNSCLHGCLYCYANAHKARVVDSYNRHDVHSPFLIGGLKEDDIIMNAKQKSYIDYQLSLDI